MDATRENPTGAGGVKSEHSGAGHESHSQDKTPDQNSQIILTYWQDLSGNNKLEVKTTWPKFFERLKNVKPCVRKKDSHLIKFARFGDTRTDAGSLRHDGNVIDVTGIEGDLDNGVLSVDEVKEKLEFHNLKAIICTTHSHIPEKPRTRVFTPLMYPCIPEARRRYVARLNGILSGNLGDESFRLSQSFFIGGKPGSEYRVEHTFDDPEEGYFIDELDELDELAIDPDTRGTNANSSEHSYKKDNTYSRTNTNSRDRGEGEKSSDNKRQQKTTFDNISFEKGGRDETLFHLALSLALAGMPDVNIEKYLKFVAAHCTPPFPEKEVSKKIQSALQRAKNKDRNLTQEIREWILTTNANFLTTDVYTCQHLTTRDEKKKANTILSRFVKDGFIERTGRRAGEYRLVDTECETIDYINAPTGQVNIFLPFKLHEMARIMPGNIVVVAGEPNAGKTAMLLNVVRDNMSQFKLHYFSSEMGGAELRERLSKFKDTSLSDWKCTFKERSENFGDVIVPGEGNVNIIDFLEMYDNFYEVSGKLAEIHRKLKGAIAIVALQKNKGTDAGLGGERSLEKPRLYLNMGHGCLKIRKCKNLQKDPATGQSVENPNGKRIDFKLVNGCKFIAQGGWHYES